MKNKALSLHLPALAALSFLLNPVVSQAMIGTFNDVADTTMVAQGETLPFAIFTAPAVSGGNVAFRAQLTNNNAGIYAGTVGATGTSVIANTTTMAPGQTVSFLSFGNASLSAGTAAFTGTYSSTGNGTGIYTGTVGSVAVARVADYTTAVPGGTGNFTGFNAPSVSGDNVAFAGTNSSATNGIYSGNATNGVTRVADTTTVPTGQTTTLRSFGVPAISGNNVAFYGTIPNVNGIYTGTVGTTGATLVVSTNSAVPGQTGNFTALGNAAISSNTVAFRGSFNGGTGIYTATVGALGASFVADTSTVAPGQLSNFTSFGLIPAVSGNNVAFLGNYSGGSGIFLSLNGTLVDVVDTGNALFGSTVSTLGFGAFGLDGNTLAFNYTLANGVSGEASVIVPAGVVPEPSTWALLGLGVAGLGVVTLRRRRAA